MKKKVVFDKPIDTVGIFDINPEGIFIAEKNGFRAILSGDYKWLDLDGLTPIPYMSGMSKADAIGNARSEGCLIYQFDKRNEVLDYLLNGE